MLPSEEIIPCPASAFKCIEGREGLGDIIIVICIFYKGAATSEIYFYHLYKFNYTDLLLKQGKPCNTS